MLCYHSTFFGCIYNSAECLLVHSVQLSVSMELEKWWTDFNEILYL
jgi:hypothetical protein